MDFATRAWNHSFPFDPIVRSLLDTDFYKLLMQQFIWEHYPNERVRWRVTNRSRRIKLAVEIEANLPAIYKFWVPLRKGPVQTLKRDEPKVGRNDDCPCGSGKKYKKCCGADGAE